MIRACVITLALVAVAACGRYGPPVRESGASRAEKAAVSSAPAEADTEACPDPNSPAPGTRTTP